MAYGQDGDRVAYASDADYSAEGSGQYRGVKRTATGVVLCGAADAAFLGILQDNPALGRTATVKAGGRSKAVAGAAIAINALLTTDAAARFVTATTGQRVHARALESASGSGVLLAVSILPGPSLAP